MQKNKLSMGYYIKKKSVLARSFRHEGEGHMNWRTRCAKYSPTCPLVFTSGMTYRTVLTTGRDENTSCPVGTEYTISPATLSVRTTVSTPYFRPQYDLVNLLILYLYYNITIILIRNCFVVLRCVRTVTVTVE